MMTANDLAAVHRLLGKLYAVMVAILIFVGLGVLGVLVQRSGDLASLRDGIASNTRVLDRIESTLTRWESAQRSRRIQQQEAQKP